jgi:hypothetical protein
MTLNKIKKLLGKKFEHYNMDSNVYDLMNYYYEKKIYYRLNKKQKEAIKELAKIKHKQNKKESEDWLNSGIFRLSCERLIKTRKINKTYMDSNNWYYDGKIVDIFDCMKKIVDNANDKNLNEELRTYCEGK